MTQDNLATMITCSKCKNAVMASLHTKKECDHNLKRHEGKMMHGTAEAEFVVEKFEGKRIMSVIMIINKSEKNGNAGKLMQKLESYARQQNCAEIWYPTVLNMRLVEILLKNRFKPHIIHDERMQAVNVFIKEIATISAGEQA